MTKKSKSANDSENPPAETPISHLSEQQCTEISEIIKRYAVQRDYDQFAIREILEEIDGLTGNYRASAVDLDTPSNLSTRNALQKLKREFGDVTKALDVIINLPSGVKAIFESQDHGYLAFRESSEQFRDLVDAISKSTNDPSPRNWYIKNLGRVFGGLVGQELKDLKSYHDAASEEYKGSFFEFARLMFHEAEFSNAALEKAIRRALE